MDMLIHTSLKVKYYLNIRWTSDYNQMRSLARDYVTIDKLIGPVDFTSLPIAPLTQL